MSKAFDTVDRKTLFSKLEGILLPEELHLFSILTRKPKIFIKVNNTLSKDFTSLIGIMQGDCMSAILFILYLAYCLINEKQIVNTYTAKLLITPKYADDITYITNHEHIIEKIEKNIPKLLRTYNLQINESKIEKYQIPKPKPPPPELPDIKTLMKHKDEKPLRSELDWLTHYNKPTTKDKTPDYKNCKLLGSLLDTTKDISRRKSLTISSMRKLKHIFNSSRISILLKMRTFQVYISSTFLYNSELWSMTNTTENAINSFHRRQLRYAIGIYWPKTINNINLYEITKAEPWTLTIKRRRLNWLGHLMRMNPNTPAREALEVALTPAKRPVGRPILTWLDTIKKDLEKCDIFLNLNNKHTTLDTLINLTKNRKMWKEKIKELMQ